MQNLVVYRQSVILSTKKWGSPHRKDGNKWNRVRYFKILCDRYDGSLRAAILRMRSETEKIRNAKKQPVWKCTMSATKVNKYLIYYLTCKRIQYN